MRRSLLVLAAILVRAAAIHADVTVVSETRAEGGLAGALVGASPRSTTRIKGATVRMDMETAGPAATISMIADLKTHQITVLVPSQKKALVVDAGQLSALPFPLPRVDIDLKPTGRAEDIDGRRCDEFTYTSTMDFASMASASARMPPEMTEMFKTVKMIMRGSIWFAKDAPGAAEYQAFQKAAIESNLPFSLVTFGGAPLQGNSDRLKELVSQSNGIGIPYRLRVETGYEGAGPLIDMLKQMGAATMTSKVTALSTDAIADDVFKVPADYELTKDVLGRAPAAPDKDAGKGNGKP